MTSGPAGGGSGGYGFFATAGLAARAGHILWYQVEPSLTWLPFRRMRRLHFGHVPITVSLLSIGSNVVAANAVL